MHSANISGVWFPEGIALGGNKLAYEVDTAASKVKGRQTSGMIQIHEKGTNKEKNVVIKDHCGGLGV